MKALATLSLAILIGCQSEPAAGPRISRTPASVRGWIQEIEAPQSELYKLRSATTGAAQAKMELFAETSVVVADFQFASGGVAENGSFIVLDVPPGDVNLTFTSSHLGDMHLPIRNVPPNADILIRGVRLTRGQAAVIDPSLVEVRVPQLKGQTAPTSPVLIQGREIVPRAVPISELEDRRDYPVPERPK
jgi:hypothetical protein